MAQKQRPYELQPASGDDYAYAESLYLQTMEPLLTALGAYDEAELAERLKSSFEPEYVRIITVAGKKVGWLQVVENEQEIALSQIHMESRYRSRGFGTEIIGELLAKAAETKRDVTLSVPRNNPAIALYRRLGFDVVGEDGWKVLMRWTAYS